MEQGLYAQVVMLCQNDLKITEEHRNEDKFNFRVSLQDNRVGLILILIGLEKNLAYMNLISIRIFFKDMMKQRIKMNLKCL